MESWGNMKLTTRYWVEFGRMSKMTQVLEKYKNQLKYSKMSERPLQLLAKLKGLITLIKQIQNTSENKRRYKNLELY